MAIPWNSTVQASKTLAVYAAPSIAKGVWKLRLDKAIDEFNVLSMKNALGVKLTKSKTAPSTSGGADVSVEAASGSISISYGGTTSKPMPFSGTAMHGYT